MFFEESFPPVLLLANGHRKLRVAGESQRFPLCSVDSLDGQRGKSRASQPSAAKGPTDTDVIMATS